MIRVVIGDAGIIFLVFLCGMIAGWFLRKMQEKPLPADQPVVVKVHEAKPVRIAFRFMVDPLLFTRSNLTDEEIAKYIQNKGCDLMHEQILDFIQYRITERVEGTVVEGFLYVVKKEEG